MVMVYKVSRYSLTKEFITTGELTVVANGSETCLAFSDYFLTEKAKALHHPIKALERLRQKLEIRHNSLLACAGCRIDSAYRATGHYRTYLVEPERPATKQVLLFEPTDAVELLCTVGEHKAAYLHWCDFFREK